MKAKRITILATVFSLFLSAQCWSVENPNVNRSGARTPSVRGSVGSGTAPVTSYSSGLHRTPNPIDSSSNLIVTGNVTGGKQFRGIVPYNAITDFGGTLGTGTLDSFLRYTSGPAGYDYYGSRPFPFYSRTGTVTSIRPGFADVFRASSLTGEGLSSQFYPTLVPRNQSSLSESYSVSPGRPRPVSMSSSEAEWMLMLESRLKARDTEASETGVKAKAGRYRGILGEPIDKQNSLNKSLLDLQSSLVKETTLKQEYEPLKMQQQKEIEAAGKEKPIEESKDEFTGLEGLDVYDQMKLKAYADQDLYGPKKIEEPVDGKAETEKTEKNIRLIRDETGQKQIEMTDVKAQSLTGIEKSALAKGVLGSYKSFASYSNDKFNHHMREAEDHLKKGEYYLADNSYSMAWIYKTEDPLVYAGRCHSLFMAGEYMSSALFLSRAINTFPEYAQLEIDIEALIGDRDGIETRLANVEELLKLRDVAELHFAAAYFYYNLGRTDKAREHIEAANGKQPEMPGVKELKEAIEGAEKK